MKRKILLSVVLALTVLLWAESHATLQKVDKGETKNPQDSTTGAMPQTYFGKGTKHKVFITDEDTSLYNEFLTRNAITGEVDYGSFKIVIVDDEALGGRSALMNFRHQVRDEQDLIPINGYVLDTTEGQLTLNKVPTDLRQTDMTDAIANRSVSPRGGLYIVQFIGPIKDGWLEKLRGAGAEIVTYVPNNAYVVSADNIEASKLVEFRSAEFVQFVGDYEPAFRLSPTLQALRAEGASASDRLVDITVQVIDGVNAAETIQQLKTIAAQFVSERQVLNYRNVALKASVSRLGEIASVENVFAVEERGEPVLHDEFQGQIVAGNFCELCFPHPAVPDYLTFLASKGFSSSQFGSFSVNVVDNARTLKGDWGHPDLPSSRVAFENNPANTNHQHAHGFMMAHIIAGFNNGTGPAFEDSTWGYWNYGLGIAPWARVGVTSVFKGPNQGSIKPADWESTAYGQSARISNNSWGRTDQNKNPINEYTVEAQEYDRIVRDAQTATAGNQQLIVVFSAGNSGPFSSTITAPGTAKNVITVGATESARAETTDCFGVTPADSNLTLEIAKFSSRGPVNSAGGDGRIKPDLVAPGTHIVAGVPQDSFLGPCEPPGTPWFPQGQTLYGWVSGTSPAAAAVSGGVALLYQHFLNKGFAPPSPAMAKAYLMNSAFTLPLTESLPSNDQGMGRMDLGRAFDETKRTLEDQKYRFETTGPSYQWGGSISDPSKPLRVTLAWTDAPGSTTGAPQVNNLDLEVNVNGTTYKGNVFSGWYSTTGGSADTKNNVESVFLPEGTSGTFRITVRATNITGDGVPGNGDPMDQDFALVVYNGEKMVSPHSLYFSAKSGGANPESQSLEITKTGVSWTASDDAPWLSVTPTSGIGPSKTNVSVNISGLAVGTYTSTITISAPGTTNSPVSVPVTLKVLPPPPKFGVKPTSLSFAATVGGANPTPKFLKIGIGSYDIGKKWKAYSNPTWLSISPAKGYVTEAESSTATVSVNISGLAPGTYNGTITIIEDIVIDEPPPDEPVPEIIPSISVPVTLTVTPPPPKISVNPASLSFTATTDGANPVPLSLSIKNAGGGVLNWMANWNATWLSVSPTSGGTGAGSSTPSVSVNISGLAQGTYQDTITISEGVVSDEGVRISPMSVPVTLTVNPPQPTISTNPLTLNFTAIAGGANPANKILRIGNSGDGTLNWTATDDVSWLSISSTSGTAPSTLTVVVNTTGLTVGTYNGTITISATGATNSPLTLPVTLTVTDPVQ